MLDGNSSVFEILTDFRGAWSATPWLYSSMRRIQFQNDGTSQLVYGSGQTIYGVINAKFGLLTDNKILLTYLASPAVGFFNGFTPEEDNCKKKIEFTLAKQNDVFSHQITGKKFTYKWKLKLNISPFPDEIQFPYEMPLELYGHRQDLE